MKKVYYKKVPTTIKAKLTDFTGVSEENFSTSLPIKYAKKQVNLKEENGKLVKSKYFSTALDNLPYIIKKIFVVKKTNGDSNFLLECENKLILIDIYTKPLTMMEFKEFFHINSACNYQFGNENYMIFATDKGLVKFCDYAFEESEIKNQFEKIVNHYYRIFGVEKKSLTLRFSNDFEPFNWDVNLLDGGYINMPSDKGQIIDLISFNQNLIVVQEHGLSKITAFSNQEDFVMKEIPAPKNIKKSSIVNCGEYFLFVCEKGLMLCNGYECKSIFGELTSILAKKQIEGVYADDNCYFLLKDKDELVSDIILAVDMKRNNYHFVDSNKKIDHIEKGRKLGVESLFAVCKNDILQLGNFDGARMVWQTGKIDFDSSEEYKLLKNIYIGGNTIVDLKINADEKYYYYSISKQRRQTVNLKAKQFELQLSPKGTSISLPIPIVEYQLLKEY